MNLCVLTLALLKTPDNTLDLVPESNKKSKNSWCHIHTGSTKKQSTSDSSRGISTGVEVWFLLCSSCHVCQSVYSFCVFQNIKKIAAHVNQILQKSKWVDPFKFVNILDMYVYYNSYHFQSITTLEWDVMPCPPLAKATYFTIFTCVSVKMPYLSQKFSISIKLDFAESWDHGEFSLQAKIRF